MVFSRLLAGDKINVIYRTNAHTPNYTPVMGIRKGKTITEMEEDSRKYRELVAAAAKENVK